MPIHHDTSMQAPLKVHVSRRRFLQTSGTIGGGLLLGCTLRVPLAAQQPARARDLNAWVRIASDDNVTIVVSQAEMGQGIATTLPAVLVEELGADWSRVRFANAPTAAAYRNPRVNLQFTGNSESVSSFFDLMRQMGAAAREMLIDTAATRWQVDPATCRAERGAVVHDPTRRRLTFGALADEAATKQPPKSPRLKPKSEWTLLGKSLPRVDAPSKVDGTAIFGLDVVVPGMAYAAVRHCPTFGGQVKAIDRASIASLSGIVDVVNLSNAVAVVAQKYWQARRALAQLAVTWDDGPHAAVSSATMMSQYRAALDGDEWYKAHEHGTMRASDPSIAATFSQVYESQFLAHAPMEPMNCTASVTADGCEIWAPTQGQEVGTIVLSKTLDLPAERIRIHRTLLGGGFGRRLVPDFMAQAALVSRAVKRPVKLIWSREEDVQHDIYRPAVAHRLTAGLDRDGRVQVMEHKVVSPSILQFVYPAGVTDTFDPSCCEGLEETHYQIPNWRADFKLLKVGVPTSVLRTTGYGPNIFGIECFVDELAERAGRDPLEYRRTLLAGQTRALAVLNLAADKARWDRPPAAGRARGIAFCEAFHTVIAQVVEVSVTDNVVRVHKVVTALDAGEVLDPDITTNSIEGGVAWGLSAALKSQITFEGGRTVQSNFHDFEVLRLHEMPETEVHVINSGARPLGGVGEVGPVTVVPALVNAVSRAIGRRLRSVPLTRHGLRAS